MKVLSIREQKDGSAIMRCELDEDEYTWFMIHGMRLIMKGKKVRVLTMDEAKRLGIKGGKKVELSDEISDACVSLAILDGIKNGIERMKRLKKISDNVEARKLAKKLLGK